MLAIRLQRIGRKKLAHYRLIAQEHRIQPTSGKVAAYLGSYNPHTKEVNLDKEKIEFYLGNGAQPSNRVAKLLQNEGVTLPDWVSITQKPDRKEEATEEAPAETEAATETGDEKKEDTQKNEESALQAEEAESTEESADTSDEK